MSKTRMTIALGLAALGLLAGSGCSQKPAWTLGLQTYTFRTHTLLESIDMVKQLGLSEIEAFSGQKIGADFGDMKLDHNSSCEAREAVKAKLDDAGVKMTAYYFHGLGHDEAVDPEIFKLVKAMGGQMIVCEPPAEKMCYVDKLANEYGINVAIHQHAKNPKSPEYKYWCPNEVLKVLEGRSARMGACADTGHWARSGVCPISALQKYEGRLMGVHLKDVEKNELGSEDVIWGQGVANMAAVLAEMHRQGFSGLAAIEYEKNPQDNIADVAACVKFHNETVETLAK